MNDAVKKSLETVIISALLEPTDIYRLDGKCPDGHLLSLGRVVRVLVWDVTCPDTLTSSCAALVTREAGAVVPEMEQRKREKYAHLDSSHFFVLITVETLEVMGQRQATSSGTSAGTLQSSLQSLCPIFTFCSALPQQSNMAMRRPSSEM